MRPLEFGGGTSSEIRGTIMIYGYLTVACSQVNPKWGLVNSNWYGYIQKFLSKI